ncbi:MAG: 30S ribosome-binding factor RbfA [Pseudomonadales bacterium]|nr:30S ribosome-binding factor RbfA [Pseudomonadales bacterium]
MNQRLDRLADQIQRDLAQLIRQEIRDPRLGLVTVSAVKVSRDLGYADIYVTVMGHDLETDTHLGSIAILNAAAGFLRGELGRMLSVRVIPRLRFHYDEVLAKANRLTTLIHHAVREDESRHHPPTDTEEQDA